MTSLVEEQRLQGIAQLLVHEGLLEKEDALQYQIQAKEEKIALHLKRGSLLLEEKSFLVIYQLFQMLVKPRATVTSFVKALVLMTPKNI